MKREWTDDGDAADAPRAPHPTDVHPESIIDAHSFPSTNESDTLYDRLPDHYPKPPVRHVVQVKMDVSASPADCVQ